MNDVVDVRTARSSRKLAPVQVAVAAEPKETWATLAVPVSPALVAYTASTGVVQSSR